MKKKLLQSAVWSDTASPRHADQGAWWFWLKVFVHHGVHWGDVWTVFWHWLLLLSADAALTDGNAENRASPWDVSASQHLLVCCLLELGRLVQGLDSTAAPLLADSSTGDTRTHYLNQSFVPQSFHRWIYPLSKKRFFSCIDWRRGGVSAASAPLSSFILQSLDAMEVVWTYHLISLL